MIVVFTSVFGVFVPGWVIYKIFGIAELPGWTAFYFFGSFLGSIAISVRLARDPNGRRRRTDAEWMESLRARGLLVTEAYDAKRYFEVEPYNDEGPHYYIELTDGRTLYLCGPQLLDYNEIDEPEEPELNQIKQFPCTQFTLHWKERTDLITIECAGSILQSEEVTSGFWRKKPAAGYPQNGDIIADRSYDEIKNERKAK